MENTKEIIELLGEIDEITRNEYASGRVEYATYVGITERLKNAHTKLKNLGDIGDVSEILEKLEFEKRMAHSGMVDCIQEVADLDESCRYEGEERAYKKAIEIVSSR